jgi:hypothetical protein
VPPRRDLGQRSRRRSGEGVVQEEDAARRRSIGLDDDLAPEDGMERVGNSPAEVESGGPERPALRPHLHLASAGGDFDNAAVGTGKNLDRFPVHGHVHTRRKGCGKKDLLGRGGGTVGSRSGFLCSPRGHRFETEIGRHDDREGTHESEGEPPEEAPAPTLRRRFDGR